MFKQRAFTLIELLVVLVILGSLIGLAELFRRVGRTLSACLDRLNHFLKRGLSVRQLALLTPLCHGASRGSVHRTLKLILPLLKDLEPA